MREKRRKIPLEVILATPVSEARRKHGQQVYASRLCVKADRLAREGAKEASERVFAEAKSYCTKNNLPFPPFSGVPINPNPTGPFFATARKDTEEALVRELVASVPSVPISSEGDVCQVSPPATATGAPASAGAPSEEALSTHSPAILEVAVVGGPQETIAGASHVTQGEPAESVRTSQGIVLHETAAPVRRKARLWAFCVNPKLLRIKFEDGNKELGSMWASRGGFRLNDIITVELERGTGENAIWEEVRSRV